MNILISQSQGETFAALSLQLLLPNTHMHAHTEMNLLPSASADCCSSSLYSSGSMFVWMCICVYWRRQCAYFPQGEVGNGMNMDNSIIGIHSVFLQMLIVAWVCACLCQWSVLMFSPQWFFAYPSQDAPVQRSRSLSPASSVELGGRRRRGAEQRIQDLEELLQLKVTTN